MLADTRMDDSIQSIELIQFLFIADIRAKRLPSRLEQGSSVNLTGVSRLF
jgi:hypothetical protein